jgi:hypothetical protein
VRDDDRPGDGSGGEGMGDDAFDDAFDDDASFDDDDRPLLPHEREDVVAELEDIATFRALLQDRGIRGMALDCEDCGDLHFFGWDLLETNLRHLLDDGRMGVHEPAYDPDPADYVTWDYARGFADAVLAADDSNEA